MNERGVPVAPVLAILPLCSLVLLYVAASLSHGRVGLTYLFYPLIVVAAVSIWALSEKLHGSILVYVCAFHLVLSSLFLIPQYRFYGWDSLLTYTKSESVLYGSTQATEVIATPLLHIFVGIVHQVLGIPLETAVKYVPLVLSTVGILAVSVFIYQRLSLRYAAIGGLVVSSVWFPTAFHVMSTKESMAIPLFLLFVVSVWRSEYSRRFFALALILLLAVVFTHHMTAFFLVVITGIVVFLNYRWRSRFASLRAISLTNWIRPRGWIIVVLSAMGVVLHWVYFYRFPIFGLASILTGFNLFPEGAVVSNNEPLFIFTSMWGAFQLLWRGGFMHFPGFAVLTGQVLVTGVFMIGIVFSEARTNGMSALMQRVRRNILLQISLSGSVFFVVLAGVAFFTGLLGSQRIVEYSWIVIVPVLVTLLSWGDKRRWIRMTMLAIIVVNLLSFPTHALAPTITANHESGELGFGFERSDYATGEWVETYGEQPVASSVKYERLWKFYDVTPYSNSKLAWLISDNYNPPPSTYVYESEIYDSFLLTRSGWTRNPVRFDARTGTAKIYDNGGAVFSTG